ncbi:hypothetical protein J3R82DRAFT_2828, partial [Butyriboletus roseoflavus]
HVMAHNVIEHSFGILKQHFWILLLSIKYDLNTQACLPTALACLHNLILTHEPLDNLSDMNNSDDDKDLENKGDFNAQGDRVAGMLGAGGRNSDHSKASIMHNHIAQHMWEDY